MDSGTDSLTMLFEGEHNAIVPIFTPKTDPEQNKQNTTTSTSNSRSSSSKAVQTRISEIFWDDVNRNPKQIASQVDPIIWLVLCL